MHPKTIEQAIQRANNITGMTIAELAKALQIPLPHNPKSAKGFIGQLVEIALGASAGSNPIQDFPSINLELKTIPIKFNGSPAETTHICVAHLNNLCGLSFENSNVYNKIKQVLWVPVEGEKDIPIGERHIGQPFLWKMNDEEFKLLKTDFEEILEYIIHNDKENIPASIGEYMQLRPIGKVDDKKQYGFYLRKNFTSMFIQKYFLN